MIEFMHTLDEGMLALRILGDVSDGETGDIVRCIRERAREHGRIRLLIDYEAPGGLISAEDLYENLRFAKLAEDAIDRLAVLGDGDWKNTWIALFGLFSGLRAAYFDRRQAPEARSWLQQA